MARYNIYGHVLYSEIEYEKLMYATEKIFMQALMSRLPSITEWTEDIWNNIDHEYMITTLEEIKREVIENDRFLLLKYKNTALDIDTIIDLTQGLENIFDLNSIDYFKKIESAYGAKVAGRYKKKLEYLQKNDNLDITEYLTQQIKDFHKIENTIPYRHSNGEIARMVNPSTYLSMLYNVNITRTGWNQTFKDADYFRKRFTNTRNPPKKLPTMRTDATAKYIHEQEKAKDIQV